MQKLLRFYIAKFFFIDSAPGAIADYATTRKRERYYMKNGKTGSF